MYVKVIKLNENVVLPFKTHKRDLCFDVRAFSEKELANGVWKYGLGIKVEIVPETESEKLLYEQGCFSIDLRPRSSVWETGMILSNSPGTIDEDYRGEIGAVFYHIFKEYPRYKVGDKIGQLVINFTIPIHFEEVDSLSDTERGEGGYGSTGK